MNYFPYMYDNPTLCYKQYIMIYACVFVEGSRLETIE